MRQRCPSVRRARSRRRAPRAIMKRLRTGGPLNLLNERSGCNARAKTVPVMALLEAHPTSDPERLRQTIEEHAFAHCAACGLRSTGPVERFALALFQAQFTPEAKGWLSSHGRHTFARCLDFQRELFCVAPIRGKEFELRSRGEVEALLRGEGWASRRATPHEDGDLAVDYVVARFGTPVFGVQVKPHTVLTRADVMRDTRSKHARCPFPVLFHVYDETGAFSPARERPEAGEGEDGGADVRRLAEGAEKDGS